MTLPQYESEPTEKRAIRIQGTAATVAGSGNTNVIAFTAVPAAWQGTLYAPQTTAGAAFVAPPGGSGGWISSQIDAVNGSVFKFNRKGIYFASIEAEGTDGDTGNAQVGITLDLGAAALLAGAGTVTALSDIVLAWQNTNGVAAVGLPIRASAPVYITDALAAGAQPAIAPLAQGVGCLRFIANNAGNAVIATALIVTSIRASIVCIGDQAG